MGSQEVDLLVEIRDELRKIATIMQDAEERRLKDEAKKAKLRDQVDTKAARLLVKLHNDERKHEEMSKGHWMLAARPLPGDTQDPTALDWDGGVDLWQRLDRHRRPDLRTWVWLNGATPPRWEIRGTGARS